MISTGFIILSIMTLAQTRELHNDMTDDEIANVFRTTRATVPAYEVVPIKSTASLFKNGLRIAYNAFGREIFEYLEPTDGYLAGNATPVWLSFGDNEGYVNYQRMKSGIIGRIVGLFQSPLRHSAVIVHQHDDSSMSFDGITHNFTIRSLPPRIKEVARRKREIEPSSPYPTPSNANFHVIMKANLLNREGEAAKFLTVKTAEMINSSKKIDGLREKRSTQDVIYPTIIVTTDYEISEKSANDGDYDHEILYQLAFWNAVDLRFRQFSSPKIRLRIAGLIIGRNREATPYIQRNKDEETVNSLTAINAFSRYWHEMIKRTAFPEEAADFLVTMTDTEMADINKDGSKAYIAGRAFLKTLCRKTLRNYWAPVAIVYDDGSFDGVITAAHETGHLLGLMHDKDTGDHCAAFNGFIMQTMLAFTEKNLEFSPCNLMELADILRDDSITCADQPKEFYKMGTPVKRILPGFFLDDHRQCQARGFSYACQQTPKMCKNLQCFHAGWQAILHGGWWCYVTGPAAEGTVCGPEERCINGECRCLSQECVMYK